MTDEQPYGDPLSRPFWAAAAERTLLLQRCDSCGHHQFYARPLCLACRAPEPVWAPSRGSGAVYSVTTVHVGAGDAPYQVALVDLAEGPRFLAGIDGPPVRIGDAVRVTWREREGLPPMPAFTIDREGAADGTS